MVDSNFNLPFKKCWQSNDIFLVPDDWSATLCLITLDVGSSEGFLNGAMLLYKLGTSGDYHGEMNQRNFEKLLTNIPPSSVIVMENTPYQSVLAEKVGKKSFVKADIVNGLVKKGVQCDATMKKEQLIPLLNKS